MTNRAVEPPPAAREFDEQPDDDLEEEETGAGENDDDGDLWDSPEEDADEDEEEGGAEEGSEAEPREASGRDTEIADGGETPGSPLAERTAPPDTGEPFAGLVIEIAIRNVIPDPDQPRLEVDTELADSIKAQGVLQPIVVRRDPTPGSAVPFMLVDGERRWRAAQAAGLDVIPARVVSDVDDAGDRLLHQVTFNEGKRLAPMEEAKAWARIMGAKGWNIQQLAAALGRAKSTVSDRLAMLDAPAPFVKYFTDGVLTAAAAPVIRRFAGIDETTATRIVQYATSDPDWEAAVNNGTPVPLKIVERALNEAASDELRTVDPRVGYTGPTVTIDKQTLALDSARYEEQDEAFWEQQQTPAAEPTTRAPSEYELKERERQRKERVAHEKKRELRRAMFDAILPKLPGTLDGNWALLLVTWLTKEIQQDYQRVFLKALGIEPEKGKGPYGGYNFQGTVIRRAEELPGPARVKFALALLLAYDLNASPYDTRGPERFAAAAKLLKVDLAKVKAPDPD